jgi:hypothetical protein
MIRDPDIVEAMTVAAESVSDSWIHYDEKDPVELAGVVVRVAGETLCLPDPYEVDLFSFMIGMAVAHGMNLAAQRIDTEEDEDAW